MHPVYKQAIDFIFYSSAGITNYANRGTARSPSSLVVNKDVPKEYQLTKDEFEFTKDYLNKDFRKYDLNTVEINSLNDIFHKSDYEREKKDIPQLSKVEVERLRKSLFNETENSEYYSENLNSKSGYKKPDRDYHLHKPDYIIKNSEFLQKSNEILSKITKDRSYKKSEGVVRDIDNRLVSDYRKVLKESSSAHNEFGLRSKDELSLQNFGSIRLRTGSLSRSYDEKDSDRLRFETDDLRTDKHQREANAHRRDKNYSTSEDEGIDSRNPGEISAYTKGFAYLLAGYKRKSNLLIHFYYLYLQSQPLSNTITEFLL